MNSLDCGAQTRQTSVVSRHIAYRDLIGSTKWVYSYAMYTRITKSGSRRYLQLVEGYRDEQGRVKQRVVANLGRIDHWMLPISSR